MDVKISVIMPVYNEEEFIEEAVYAFAHQTMASECELICVDDGSNDRSLDILQYLKNLLDVRMIILQQDNLGSGAARNAGMDAAHGEFIAFLDADDSYPANDVLEVMYSMAKQKVVGAVGGSIELLKPDGRHRFEPSDPSLKGQRFDFDCLMEFRDYQFEYGFYRFIFKRSALQSNNVRFPDFLRFQDPCFFVRALDTIGTFFALHKLTYTYRSNAEKVRWDSRKVGDLLDGILDLGMFAQKRGYRRLYMDAVTRLCVSFDPIICETITSSNDVGLFERYCDTLRKLMDYGRDLDMNVDDLFSQSDFFAQTLNALQELKEKDRELKDKGRELKEAGDKLSQSQQELANVRKELADQAHELEDLREESEQLRNEAIAQRSTAEATQSKLVALQKSKSFRIGRATTWLPRKIKRAINR